ncbi:hypothetical protein RND81_06G007000 [Saponaria officinalis]|uniref:Uncharacterized protein n=1 Tax=Saponaria officinalis TaxID=3572 RepID=A0AAW1K4R8_SAPOF
MCYRHEEEWHNRTPPPNTVTAAARLAALLDSLSRRLTQAKAREAALSRQLRDMKRFVSVMEILECYLKRRFCEQQVLLHQLLVSSQQIVLCTSCLFSVRNEATMRITAQQRSHHSLNAQNQIPSKGNRG